MSGSFQTTMRPVSKRDCCSRYPTTRLFIPVDETPAVTAKTNNSLRKLVDGLPIDTVLFHLLATLETGKLSETFQNDVTEIKVFDVLLLPQAQTGVEWIYRKIDGLTQKTLRKVPPGKKWWENGKKTTMTFRWKNEELVIDNKDTMLAWNKYPYFSINLTLALQMDGLREREQVTTSWDATC